MSVAHEMKLLSSRSTPVTKFLLPGMFMACIPLWAMAAAGPAPAWIFAILWVGACAFMVWWTLPIKKVQLVEDQFRISNYRRTVEVPTAHLDRFSEDRYNQTPNLTLYFSPPTPFGPKVRIIPPIEMLSRTAFDQIAAILQEIVRRNRGGAPPATPRMTARTLELLAYPTLEKSAAVVDLTEAELNDLIDHLPHDSALRDVARQERQKRWYG